MASPDGKGKKKNSRGSAKLHEALILEGGGKPVYFSGISIYPAMFLWIVARLRRQKSFTRKEIAELFERFYGTPKEMIVRGFPCFPSLEAANHIIFRLAEDHQIIINRTTKKYHWILPYKDSVNERKTPSKRTKSQSEDFAKWQRGFCA